jgi:hypothetical protein
MSYKNSNLFSSGSTSKASKNPAYVHLQKQYVENILIFIYKIDPDFLSGISCIIAATLCMITQSLSFHQQKINKRPEKKNIPELPVQIFFLCKNTFCKF